MTLRKATRAAPQIQTSRVTSLVSLHAFFSEKLISQKIHANSMEGLICYQAPIQLSTAPVLPRNCTDTETGHHQKNHLEHLKAQGVNLILTGCLWTNQKSADHSERLLLPLQRCSTAMWNTTKACEPKYAVQIIYSQQCIVRDATRVHRTHCFHISHRVKYYPSRPPTADRGNLHQRRH